MNPLSLKKFFPRFQPLRAAKIALGAALSCLLASLFGLAYSTSAGVITILSLQNTKRETILLVFKRILAFFIALLLAMVCFQLLGYRLPAIGLFLLCFAAVCQIGSLQDALAMDTVLILHFYAEGSMSPSWIANEIALLFIGASIGVALNLYIPGNVRSIKNSQFLVEDTFRSILGRMASSLLRDRSKDAAPASNPSADRAADFPALLSLLSQLEEQALENYGNTLISDSSYFIHYVEMRKEQAHILQRIQGTIDRLEQLPEQAAVIAAFLESMSRTFRETNNAKTLSVDLEQILQQLKQEPLPRHRAEFENRALLYHLLHDLDELISRKRAFADSLTPDEIARFWQEP